MSNVQSRTTGEIGESVGQSVIPPVERSGSPETQRKGVVVRSATYEKDKNEADLATLLLIERWTIQNMFDRILPRDRTGNPAPPIETLVSSEFPYPQDRTKHCIKSENYRVYISNLVGDRTFEEMKKNSGGSIVAKKTNGSAPNEIKRAYIFFHEVDRGIGPALFAEALRFLGNEKDVEFKLVCNEVNEKNKRSDFVQKMIRVLTDLGFVAQGDPEWIRFETVQYTYDGSSTTPVRKVERAEPILLQKFVRPAHIEIDPSSMKPLAIEEAQTAFVAQNLIDKPTYDLRWDIRRLLGIQAVNYIIQSLSRLMRRGDDKIDLPNFPPDDKKP